VEGTSHRVAHLNVAQSRCASRYVKNGWLLLIANAAEEVNILLDSRKVCIFMFELLNSEFIRG
jgi:hypothetical protein